MISTDSLPLLHPRKARPGSMGDRLTAPTTPLLTASRHQVLPDIFSGVIRRGWPGFETRGPSCLPPRNHRNVAAVYGPEQAEGSGLHRLVRSIATLVGGPVAEQAQTTCTLKREEMSPEKTR